jgi:antitoxin HigA-1
MARKKREIPPVHPGEILSEEFLKPLGLSMNQLALALRVPGNRVNAIVAGQRGITADTALRLGRYFGTSAQFLDQSAGALRPGEHQGQARRED